MPKGTVKYFNQQKGFGFIRPHDGSPEIFYHMKDAIEFVDVNEKCIYEVVDTSKGLNAINVKKLDSENASD